jgi:hypothetical protein
MGKGHRSICAFSRITQYASYSRRDDEARKRRTSDPRLVDASFRMPIAVSHHAPGGVLINPKRPK